MAVIQGRTVAWVSVILLCCICIRHAKRRHGGRGYVRTRAGFKTASQRISNIWGLSPGGGGRVVQVENREYGGGCGGAPRQEMGVTLRKKADRRGRVDIGGGRLALLYGGT